MIKTRIYAHSKQVSFASRVGEDTNFFTPTRAEVLVAGGSSSHGDGSP